MTELEEEHGGEEGAFSELDKVNKANIAARLKEIKGDPEAKDEAEALNAWLKHAREQAAQKKALKDAEAALDAQALAHYPTLTEAEIKTLVVDDKWLDTLDTAIGDSRVAFAINEVPQSDQAVLELGLVCIPHPTLDGLQYRDPIRRQPIAAELIAAAADPRAELEVLPIDTLDMAIGDSRVAFAINEVPQSGQTVLIVGLECVPHPTIDGLQRRDPIC